MSTDVLMPQLGESIVEGTIVRWNKTVGDSVERDEPLFEVSTDKVDAEIPSPVAGIVVAIKVGNGETVPVDSVVAVIDDGSKKDSSPVEKANDLNAETNNPLPADDAKNNRQATNRGGGVSPVVRRIAREHNIDVTTIRGTGAGGRVTKEDVMSHVQSGSPEVRSEQMTVMRKKIADHMISSRRTSAHVHTIFDVDFGRIEELRKKWNGEKSNTGTKLTYLPFIARAVVIALAEVPVINASVKEDQIVYCDQVNLGIAVALEDGLIVPVIKKADSATVLELSRAIVDLSGRARNKALKTEEVDGGTFTITNPGVFGSIAGVPIINQPQLAILAVGAVEKRPVVSDDDIKVGLRSYLTLGFDHRIIDGAVADQFMSVVKAHIEQFDEELC